jgi:hypothetical protein
MRGGLGKPGKAELKIGIGLKSVQKSSKIHQLFNTPATSPSSEGCNSVSKLNPESVLSTRKTRQYQPPHKAIHAISLFLLSLCGCGGCGGQGAQ